jgi:hypothetical protein
MKQEERDLLLKDLCGRLPYGVKVITSVGGEIRNDKVQLNFAQLSLFEAGHEDIKPYLFPLSSMTEEQKKEEYEICKYYLNGYESKLIDFYHKNHLDYRGLIPMGLANDATGLSIY